MEETGKECIQVVANFGLCLAAGIVGESQGFGSCRAVGKRMPGAGLWSILFLAIG